MVQAGSGENRSTYILTFHVNYQLPLQALSFFPAVPSCRTCYCISYILFSTPVAVLLHLPSSDSRLFFWHGGFDVWNLKLDKGALKWIYSRMFGWNRMLMNRQLMNGAVVKLGLNDVVALLICGHFVLCTCTMFIIYPKGDEFIYHCWRTHLKTARSHFLHQIYEANALWTQRKVLGAPQAQELNDRRPGTKMRVHPTPRHHLLCISDTADSRGLVVCRSHEPSLYVWD